MVSIVFFLFVFPVFVLVVIFVHDLIFPTRQCSTTDGFELKQSTMI